jgi:hypothetical protein
MFAVSMMPLASMTERSRGMLRTGEDMICSTVIWQKSFPWATVFFSMSVSVTIPNTFRLSETIRQDTLLLDMIFAAETTGLSGLTVATFVLMMSPAFSHVRGGTVTRDPLSLFSQVRGGTVGAWEPFGLELTAQEPPSLIWLSTNSLGNDMVLFFAIVLSFV